MGEWKALFWAFIFFSAFVVITCSGRLGSVDAYNQLAAAYVFVTTGRVGAIEPPGGFDGVIDFEGTTLRNPKGFFWQAPNGLYYQTHDIGNAVLMVPLAAVGVIASSIPGEKQVEEAPMFIKVFSSVYFSLIGAIVSTILFACFRLSLPSKTSFFYAALFLPTGFFLTYTRMPWDVAGAGVFAILAFYQVISLICERGNPLLQAALAGTAAGFATNFRNSFGPFLVLIVVASLWPYRHRISKRQIGLFCVCLFACALPSLVYNFVRMGDPFHPATIIPKYPTKPELTWAIPENLVRMFFSLNKGLFVFSPLLLFAFLARDRHERALRNAVLLGTLAYALGLAATPSWSGGWNCWGPRYLVPLVPIMYYLAVAQINNLSPRWRPMASVAIVASLLLNFPSFCTNSHLAIQEYPGGLDDKSNYPYPQSAVWQAVISGIKGELVPVTRSTLEVLESGEGSASRTFPDNLLAHLARRSMLGFAISLMLGSMLLIIMLFAYRQLKADFVTATSLLSESSGPAAAS